MKKIRVYFNISNYDTINVKYRILKGSDVIHEDIINTTEPFITIPYYSGASYELRYYAENIVGRMDEKIYKFNSPDILEGVFDISVQLANTKDSATISWNKVADSSGYTLYIYTPDAVSKLALNDTQYIFKPTAENDYAFAVECNGLMSQRTLSYHLYNKPIFGTNQKPLPPQLTAGYTYDVAMREASITINLTHSSSTDVVGSYLQIIFPDSTKEIYYLPNSPSALEKVKRQYIVKETSQFKFSAYSITIDNQVSDVVEYTLNVVPESTTPPTPSISQITTGYDTELQQPYVDISINPVSWVTNIDYNVAYRYGNNTEWSYARTSSISLRVVIPYGGIPFYAKVQAIDSHNMKSLWSDVATLNVAKDEIAPAVPTNLSAEALFQNVAVEWTPVPDNDLSEYILQVATDEEFTENLQTIHTETTRYTYAGETNTTYYFRVKAVDFSGNESEFSTPVSASTVRLDGDKLEDGAVTDEKIRNVTADKITAGTLQIKDYIESPIIKVTKKNPDNSYYDAVLINGNGITVNKGNITVKDGENETILDSDGINANAIKTGTLTITDTPDTPNIVVIDSDENELVKLDKDGLTINRGSITIKDGSNETIVDGNGVYADKIVGGVLQANSYIQVGDEEKGYKIDGNAGINLLLGGHQYRVSSILKRGTSNQTIFGKFEPMEIDGQLDNFSVVITPKKILTYSDRFKEGYSSEYMHDIYQSIGWTKTLIWVETENPNIWKPKEVLTPTTDIIHYAYKEIDYNLNSITLTDGLPTSFPSELPTYTMANNLTYQTKNICAFKVTTTLFVIYDDSQLKLQRQYTKDYIRTFRQPHELPLTLYTKGWAYKIANDKVYIYQKIESPNRVIELTSVDDWNIFDDDYYVTIPYCSNIYNILFKTVISKISPEEKNVYKEETEVEYTIIGD